MEFYEHPVWYSKKNFPITFNISIFDVFKLAPISLKIVNFGATFPNLKKNVFWTPCIFWNFKIWIIWTPCIKKYLSSFCIFDVFELAPISLKIVYFWAIFPNFEKNTFFGHPVFFGISKSELFRHPVWLKMPF